MTAPQPPQEDKPEASAWALPAHALLAVALLLAAGLITRGVWLLSDAAGWISGGLLLAGVALLFMFEDGK